MSLISYLAKQFIGVVSWNEPQEGVLAWRYPMHGLEIQNGGQLTVSESQVAVFAHHGRIADIFGPGLHTLSPRNLPVLASLIHWDADSDLPFHADVYFFSTRLQLDRKWGTATPIGIHDQKLGAVSVRCSGMYTYRIADPRLFFTQLDSKRSIHLASDFEVELRDLILGHLISTFAVSGLSLLDLTETQTTLARRIVQQVKPVFGAYGLELNQFVIEEMLLPGELVSLLSQRKGPNQSDSNSAHHNSSQRSCA